MNIIEKKFGTRLISILVTLLQSGRSSDLIPITISAKFIVKKIMVCGRNICSIVIQRLHIIYILYHIFWYTDDGISGALEEK